MGTKKVYGSTWLPNHVLTSHKWYQPGPTGSDGAPRYWFRYVGAFRSVVYFNRKRGHWTFRAKSGEYGGFTGILRDEDLSSGHYPVPVSEHTYDSRTKAQVAADLKREARRKYA